MSKIVYSGCINRSPKGETVTHALWGIWPVKLGSAFEKKNLDSICLKKLENLKYFWDPNKLFVNPGKASTEVIDPWTQIFNGRWPTFFSVVVWMAMLIPNIGHQIRGARINVFGLVRNSFLQYNGPRVLPFFLVTKHFYVRMSPDFSLGQCLQVSLCQKHTFMCQNAPLNSPIDWTK